MSALAELQRRIARTVLGGRPEAALPPDLPPDLAPHLAQSPMAARAALRVHRETALGGLRDALRLGFPTVAALIGDACFNAAVAAFAVAHPPRSACLALYGDAFPCFLSHHAATSALCYLPDVARLDRMIVRVSSHAYEGDDAHVRTVELDTGLQLRLPSSLQLFECDHPADEIRAAIAENDDAALARIDMTPRRRRFALWRNAQGAACRPLTPAVACWLAELLEGRSVAAALHSASATEPGTNLIAAIDREIFRASFARVVAVPTSSPGGIRS
jgi:hypothetical protein